MRICKNVCNFCLLHPQSCHSYTICQRITPGNRWTQDKRQTRHAADTFGCRSSTVRFDEVCREGPVRCGERSPERVDASVSSEPPSNPENEAPGKQDAQLPVRCSGIAQPMGCMSGFHPEWLPMLWPRFDGGRSITKPAVMGRQSERERYIYIEEKEKGGIRRKSLA